MVLTADLRERDAEYAEYAAIAAVSEVQFGGWQQVYAKRDFMSLMSPQRMVFSREMSVVSSSAAMTFGKIGSTTSVGNGKGGFCADCAKG